MKSILLAALLSGTATLAMAADKYVLDSSHSQVLFSYQHLGFSTTWGLFSGFEGEIMFDSENPDASSVNVSMPASSLFTGWGERQEHFLSEDFFGAAEDDIVTFASTGIEVTGEDTAKITGDLTINGVTKSVVLDTNLNQAGEHPMAGKAWLGFDATTTLVRSEYDMGKFAPHIGDEVELKISIEAMKAE